MKKTIKKVASVVLVLVQLFAMMPVLTTVTEAAQADTEIPILNKTIVGTVQFQSFNFLGDNASGSDGVDYSSTFYYTDDYFSSSSIHETSSTSLNWSDLTQNELSLASTSFDLTVAAYASNENNVLNATSRSWDNTYYPGKDKNARSMLETCGFTNFESYSTYDQAPINDSIGYVIASKPITVWDETIQSNKDFTLIAVAVRGAGYGAEWASNVTIGDKNTNSLPSNGRHWGFDDAAKTVCNGIQSYLTAHNISEDAKYWITGFSRAGATANLVAGYVTDDAESIYHTHQRDVYGFTWECPQGAAESENALQYKNIHNIINAMDAVPKVSPDAFQHQRLGIDYVMPYYGNTNAAQNTAYYTQMREVLKTIAVGAYNYAGEYYTEDPLISVTDPSNYPYNRPMTVYTITATQLIGDAVDGVLMENFGTVSATGSAKKLQAKYIDSFIDDLINVFLVSGAWNGKIGSSNTTSALNNRTKFISEYQPHFRNVLGYLLDYSGPAFLGMVDALVDAIGDQLRISNILDNGGLALAFTNFYSYPTSTYKFGIPPFIDPWIGNPSWAGKTRRAVLIDEAQPVVRNVLQNMTSGFIDPQGITRTQFENSMDKLVELVVNLYADELSRYNSNYFGTTLHYMWQILCTHEQEVVMSWIKSLDPNHMNRSCRTIKLPADCDATLYEYRPEFEGVLDDDLVTTAPVVAEVKNGAIVDETLKDQRIYCTTANGNTIIRYPASLQIRADITSDNDFTARSVQVADYRTTNAYNNVSKGESQFKTTTLDSSTGYSAVINASSTNVTSTNTALNNYGTISAGDTLHILADDIAAYNGDNPNTYALAIDKASVPTIVSYTKATADLNQGTDAATAVRLGTDKAVEMTTDTSRSITTRQKTIVVPASNVYYDDELTTVNSQSTYTGDTTRVDRDDEGTILWYQFRGTRIDLYCTTDSTTGYVMAAVYENNDGEPGERVDFKTIIGSSETTRYNVPTISFDGLDANTDYFLRLYAIRGANYQLDGIRVYHGADEDDADVKAAYEAAGEQDAKYVNLRGMLLNNISEETLQDNNETGALFYTDSGTSYAITSDEYLMNSPKNEIYLQTGQSVAFQIIGSYEKVAVGLSAPESKTDGGAVTVSDGNGSKTLYVANALDQYYVITPAPNGSVMIRNSGDSMIAITNVKLSGKYTPPEGAAMSVSAPLMVTRSLLRYASSFVELPETEEEPEAVTDTEEETPPVVNPPAEQTPEPEPSSPATVSTNETLSLSKMLSKLVQRVRSLFGF